MDRTQQLLVPARHRVRNPLYLDNCALWLRPDAGVYTGGCRTLTAGDKSSFVGTARNTTRIAGVDFWFSVWVNLANFTLYPNIYRDFDAAARTGIVFYIDNAGKPSIELYDGSGSVKAYVYNASAITANVWSHVMFTADRDGNGTWYVNGVAGTSASIAAANGSNLSTSSAIYPAVGGYNPNFVSGSIAMIGYGEGYVPTAADVTALYNGGNGLTYAEVEALGGSLAASLVSNASRTGFWYNCNEQDPTQGLIDQAGTLDLTRTAAELLTNTGFETRTGRTWASFVATDKAHLETADSSLLDLDTRDIFITASVKRASTGTQVICGKVQDSNNYWLLYLNVSGYVYMDAVIGASSKITIACSTTALSSTTTPYHIAVLIDRSNNANTKVYVNGVSQSFATNTISADDISNTGKFYVGADTYGSFWNGYIAQLGIGHPADASTAATQTAAGTTIYNSGLGQYYGEMSVADKRVLGLINPADDTALGAFWDLTEASGNRTDKVSSLVLSEVKTVNVLTNGDFETVTATGPPANFGTWAETVGAGCNLEVSADVHGGSNACKFTKAAGQSVRIEQTGVMVAGRSYTWTAWAKRGAAGVPSTLFVTDDAGASGGGSQALTDSYAAYTGTIVATSTGVRVAIGTDNTCIVDDITLTAASIPCVSDADVFGSWTEGVVGSSTVEIETMTPIAGALSFRTRIDASGNEAYATQAAGLTSGNSYLWSVTSKVSSLTSSSFLCPVNAGITVAYTSTDATVYSGTNTANRTTFLVERAGAGSPGKTFTWDTVSCKSAAVAVGNGPAECCATNSGSGTGLDGKFVGVTAAGLVTNWKTDVPTPLAGAGGYAFQFDGVDDYLTIADFAHSLTTLSAFVWVKTTTADIGKYMVGHCDYGNNNMSWAMSTNSGKLRVLLSTTGANGIWAKIYDSPSAVNDGSWHLVGFTFSSGTLLVYVDGAEVTPTKVTDNACPTLFNSAAAVTIGALLNNGVGGVFGPHLLDDVRIYNSVLSAAQIAQLYAGQEATGATPVGHWSFDPPDGPFGIPSDGDPVWGWESQDSNRRMFNQSTAGSRPIMHIAEANGKPALYFDGTDDFLTVASAYLSGTQGTVMIVAKLVDPTSCTFLSSADTATATKYLQLGTNAADQLQLDQDNTDTNDTIRGGTTLGTGLHAYFFESSDTAYSLAIDDVDEAKTVVAGADNGDWWDAAEGRDNTVIGALTTSGGSSLYLEGFIFDIAVYTTKLTASQRTRLWRDYVRRWYGI